MIESSAVVIPIVLLTTFRLPCSMPSKAIDKAARKAAKAEKKANKEARRSRTVVEEPAEELHEGKQPACASARDVLPSASSSGQSPVPPLHTFDATPFDPKIVAALKEAFSAPSQIQAQAWPVALTGADLVAVAKTGSGKTLAFLLPILHKLSRTPAPPGNAKVSPRALVLAPTRELAQQTALQTSKFAPLVGCSSSCIFGGQSTSEQKAAMRAAAPALLVATPGRLKDFIDKAVISLARCEAVVLDEADRMLDMGFEPQLKAIFGGLPEQRQTLLFTATWPKSVRKLASTYMRSGEDAVNIFSGGSAEDVDAGPVANISVSQEFVHATDDEKEKKLYDLLCELEEGSRVIAFANTKRRCEHLATLFWNEGFGSCAIHGDKPQAERESALAKFANNDCPLMFATSVAARGLDIKKVTHVINFDMARDVEEYVHRIGRTGRAGASGKAITFWNPDYDKECAPGLVKIARTAGQPVPDWLAKYEKAKANKLWATSAAEAAAAVLRSTAAA
ncbi:hypothetical protein AB1Y20_023400 [Prymnesium parvum]|uniref:RNA helicase n=1 Tax=Prymnesium parvum TaxID=97485 RepID=A0AB34JED4_PRYPA